MLRGGGSVRYPETAVNGANARQREMPNGAECQTAQNASLRSAAKRYGCRPVRSPADSGRVKVRDIISLLERDDWRLVRTRGSHHHYKHPIKAGIVTVPGTGNDDVAPGTLRSIFKQAGLMRPSNRWED